MRSVGDAGWEIEANDDGVGGQERFPRTIQGEKEVEAEISILAGNAGTQIIIKIAL